MSRLGDKSYDTRDGYVIDGRQFRCQIRVTVPATSSNWYRVTIPADRVIATLSRIWISDMGHTTLTVYGLPTGGTVGTPYTNRNMNGRSTATSSVIIAPYTVAPTVSETNRADDDLQPSGGPGTKSPGTYIPQQSFRIYAPGEYAVRATNNNNTDCPMIIEYIWLDVPTLESLR